MDLVTQIGYFNAVVLSIVCLIAIFAQKTKYNNISIVLAVEFFVFIGLSVYVSPIGTNLVNALENVYYYTFMMMIQFIFLVFYVYLSSLSLAMISAAIIGIFSYSVASALYAIHPLYYEQLMQGAAVAQILALIIGVLIGCKFTKCIHRSGFDRFRTCFTRSSNTVDHK